MTFREIWSRQYLASTKIYVVFVIFAVDLSLNNSPTTHNLQLTTFNLPLITKFCFAEKYRVTILNGHRNAADFANRAITFVGNFFDDFAGIFIQDK